MPSIRALFLDLDNTLTNDSESLRQSLLEIQPLLIRHFPELTEETVYHTFRRVNNKHWENYDDSPIAKLTNALDVRALIAREFLEELGHPNPELARELAREFQKKRRQTYVCYEDTIPVLQSLKKEMSLVLITNGNAEMQREKIVRCQLEPLLDAIFIAQEAGVSKPSPEIFHMALESINAVPEESMMVGDHPEKDIRGAQSVGMKTAWIRRGDRDANAPGLHPDYIVRTMTEVQEIARQHAER